MKLPKSIQISHLHLGVSRNSGRLHRISTNLCGNVVHRVLGVGPVPTLSCHLQVSLGKTSWWETRKALWNETVNCARSSFLSGLKPKLWKKKNGFWTMFNQKDLTRITCNMMQPMPASFAHQLGHWEFHAETSKRCKVQLWEVVFCLTNSPYLNRLADDQKLNRKQKAEVKKSRTIPKLKTLSNSGKLPYICNMTTRTTFRQWQGAAMTASTACCLKPRWDCEFSQQGNQLRLHIWQCQPTVLFVKCSLE